MKTARKKISLAWTKTMSKRDSYEHRETVNEKDKNALKNSERMGKRTKFVEIKRKNIKRIVEK